MKVIVASKDPIIIEGVQRAFRDFFPNTNLEIEGVTDLVKPSKIPLKDQKIYEVARNKISKIDQELGKKKKDYIVSVSNGVISQYGNFFNCYVILVKEKNGKLNWGLSTSFEIPIKYVGKINDAKDDLEKKGGIKGLSKGNVDTSKIIADATIMALARSKWV